FEDDASDELTNDPVFKSILDKRTLASQPTISRFFNRMDEDTLNQFLEISKILRKKIYSIQTPEAAILDLDSTLLEAYGKQEGRAFNFHYQSNGYHPLVCYDGITGDLIKIQLRDGTQYSCTGVVDFLQPVLDEYLNDYPAIRLLLRGDSGFATPELYKQCEENGTSYVIRLKENKTLRSKASDLVDKLDEITQKNKVDYAVVYGEFMYQAGSWPYERRVVCKVEKPENQMVYLYTFIVTNMDSSPEYLIKFYCKRGLMENFIKESKSGFDFASVSSHKRIVNAGRLQVHALAYNIFNWFRRLVLSAKMRKQRIDTIRLKLLKIAAKVIRSARYITFKLCSSCPYQK
ncbi:MAG: IS1380 family transposase, partial [Lachnospiraceae bacterium]|nr:IS1380 family transposase [Lachnospiraceae bacterium]